MPRYVLALAVSLLMLDGAAASVSTADALQNRLEPGDQAPDFVLPGSDGKTYKLADYRGKRAVVIAWFARAFSAG